MIRRILPLLLAIAFTATATAQTTGHGVVVTSDGVGVSDAAVMLKGRPTYITDSAGRFEFAIDSGTYRIERVVRPGYRLVSPPLPYVSTDSVSPVRIVMEQQESSCQRTVREYGASLYRQALECERRQLYGDGADSMIRRADLDTMNVRWQYEAGEYFHKYGDYSTAQKFYNRAIHKARELYGDKNQYLAHCYQLYGDNYMMWRVWGEDSKLNYADAKTYYQQAGHYWYSLLGESNRHTALIYNKMSHCWLELDNAEAARKCLDKAVGILEGHPDGDARLLAQTYENLVYVYLKLIEGHYAAGRYDACMELLQKSLAIEKQLHGEEGEVYLLLLHQIDLLKEEMPGNGEK